MKDAIFKSDFAAKIAQLQKELRETPRHKGTEHYLGRLKAQIANLKKQERQFQKSGGHFGFIPKKEGDATVVLIGPPSVGKSTLLNKLTQAQARVEAWPFTTVKVIPGMWFFKGAQIQIFDLPGILSGAALGVGRGREVLSATRSADLLILMVDVKSKNQIKNILKELKQVGVDLPILTVVNKIDLIEKTDQQADLIFISAEKEKGLEELKEKIWQELKLMRVFLKKKGQQPDLQSPLILKQGQKVKDVVAKIFPPDREIKQVFLWGPSARFSAQQVSLSHQLQDGDILTFS